MIGRLSLPSEPLKPPPPVAPFLAIAFALFAVAFLLLESPLGFVSAREGQFVVSKLGDAEEQVQVGALPNGTVRIVVRIGTDRKGTITKIAVRDLDAASAPKQLATDFSELKRELSKLHDELRIRPMRLIFELDANLPYASVVELLDLGTLAGFTDIAPIMIPDNRLEVDVINPGRN